jgi:L-2-hydroxyglutarate oxidase LhgO
METVYSDCLIIGGGVTGLTLGRQIAPKFNNVFLIEKNSSLAEETSSRNSEVIHAGIYYAKDSLKSTLCVDGKNLLYKYLNEKNILYNKCGKFILATEEKESERLGQLIQNAMSCGVDDLVFDSKLLKSEYPFLNFIEALYSPSSGIFDSHSYIQALTADFEAEGGHIVLNNQYKKISSIKDTIEVVIHDKNSDEDYLVKTHLLINAAGLSSVDIYNSYIENTDEHIIPKYFKGDYYSYYGKEKINHLIYPMPEDHGLGIHATIDLQGNIRFGPNAYEIDVIDYDINSDNKELFSESIRRYWPNVNTSSLKPSYSGIRSKLEKEDDYLIKTTQFSGSILISVLGYESPGLTASLALARYIDETTIKNNF